MALGTILYVGGFRLPDKNAAAHRVIANCKILRDLGYDVVLLGVRDADGDSSVKENERYFGFECWSVPYPSSGRDWIKYIVGSEALVAFITRRLRDARAAIVFYNYPSISQMRVARRCVRMGAKHLVDATEWYDASGGSLLFRAIKWLDTSLRMHVVHRRADGVITTSKFLTDFYSRKGKLVTELPTLFDVETFWPPLPINSGKIRRFIYVGSPFDPERVNASRSNVKERLDQCLSIFHAMHMEGRKFKFSIYGIEQETYVSVYPEHAALLQDLEGIVEFNGRRPHDEVLAEVARSDFSIFFRDQTRVTLAGFPSKVAESITCGTPVVTNAMPSLEPYAQKDWILLASDGDRLALVRSAIDTSDKAVIELKRSARNSRCFDYRAFTPSVSDFLAKLWSEEPGSHTEST